MQAQVVVGYRMRARFVSLRGCHSTSSVSLGPGTTHVIQPSSPDPWAPNLACPVEGGKAATKLGQLGGRPPEVIDVEMAVAETAVVLYEQRERRVQMPERLRMGRLRGNDMVAVQHHAAADAFAQRFSRAGAGATPTTFGRPLADAHARARAGLLARNRDGSVSTPDSSHRLP